MEQRAHIPVGPPVANPLPSYWQNPKSPLAAVIEPSVDNANETYDFAIIGSGISGTLIAYNLLLTSPSYRIVMLEAREICSGATGRNGGHTKAASYRSYVQHVQDLGQEEALKIARLEWENITEMHALARELGIECESTMCRTLDVVYDEGTFEAGKRGIEMLRGDANEDEKKEGEMAWYKVHDAEEALGKGCHVAGQNGNPEVDGEEKVAGMFEYMAGKIHAYHFTTGVLKQCVKMGLLLCAKTPVHEIRSSTRSDIGDQFLWDIFTQYNNITARNVVLATNGYTPYLMRALHGAIVPMRGQITVQRPRPANKLACPLPKTYSFIYRDGYEYMIPRPLADGTQHIIIGGGLGRLPAAGASEYGTVDDSSLNPDVSRYLHESLPGYFGSENWGTNFEEKPPESVVQEWTGIMGATADGRPFVGEVPRKKGMWISAGFNGHGMVLCLKSAEALVKMMEADEHAGKPEWFPDSFLITVERLKKGAFRGRTDMQVLI
jgi:glycine/D-amino acid oxidase-like deaminating enzyme